MAPQQPWNPGIGPITRGRNPLSLAAKHTTWGSYRSLGTTASASDPITLANPIVHFRADDDAVGVTYGTSGGVTLADGVPVSSITELVNTSSFTQGIYSASAGSPSGQPVYVSAGAGIREKELRFNGSATLNLQITGPGTLYPVKQEELTVVGVINPSGVLDGGVECLFESRDTLTSGFKLYATSGSSSNVCWSDTGVVGGAFKHILTSGTTGFVATFKNDQIPTFEAELYGVSSKSSSGGDTYTTSFMAPHSGTNTMVLGNDSTTGYANGNGYKGRLQELAIFDRSISQFEQNQIFRYFKEKYHR